MFSARFFLPLAAVLLLGVGPCGRLPGGQLSGEAPDSAVLDWGFINRTADTCALEVRPASPHSVTVNCMAAQGRLYVGCTECSGKTWSSAALEDPRGKLLLNGTLYPVKLSRVTAPDTITVAWAVRAMKYQQNPQAPLGKDYWLFELQSR